MDRNRIRYFFVAVAFFIIGYLARTMNGVIWHELSFLLICAGSYFIFSIQFRKAAAWVLILINVIVQCGLQFLSCFSLEWYNFIYNSKVGGFILGAPFDVDMMLYIILGTLGGAALELALRKFNKIGMG